MRKLLRKQSIPSVLTWFGIYCVILAVLNHTLLFIGTFLIMFRGGLERQRQAEKLH